VDGAANTTAGAATSASSEECLRKFPNSLDIVYISLSGGQIIQETFRTQVGTKGSKKSAPT
jgi:hypothetical protein